MTCRFFLSASFASSGNSYSTKPLLPRVRYNRSTSPNLAKCFMTSRRWTSSGNSWMYTRHFSSGMYSSRQVSGTHGGGIVSWAGRG
ncbi:hypothetical protein E2C01_005677 [Portunus trituberculatus]|uniref:Uncharacterized protein n=1 Tax=Portunus trituberculatus TaxID=210409 RepID=A0A5B7CU30_PORTR|nr:hypothetical protein [Portunus trituberculatus]